MDDKQKQEIAAQIRDVLPAPEAIREDWHNLIIDSVLERVWERPGLAQRDKSLVTISALTVLNMPHELKLHIQRGVSNGLSQQEISEAIPARGHLRRVSCCRGRHAPLQRTCLIPRQYDPHGGRYSRLLNRSALR